MPEYGMLMKTQTGVNYVAPDKNPLYPRAIANEANDAINTP